MIMHASEIPEGNYWQKVVAKEAHQDPLQLRLRRDAPLGGPGGLAVHPPADRRGPAGDAPGDRPDDARRHARLRPVAASWRCTGCTAIKDAMTKHIIVISDGDPTAADATRHQPAVREQDHGDGRPDRRARQRPGRASADAEPRQANQGPVLQRHQPEGAAPDLPEGSPADLAPADLRAGRRRGRPAS